MSEPVAAVEFPAALLAKVDAAVGAEERSSFIARATESALRRRNLRAFLDDVEENGPVMRDEDHPEFAEGTYAYIRKLRDAGEKRMEAVEAAWRRD